MPQFLVNDILTMNMKSNPSPAIDVQGLTKRFGKFTAVDNVSFRVEPGEIFGFLGPNGAGKSTTIRMLCGLLSSSSGAARVGGYDINREPEQIRARLGYMSQKFSLYRDLTVAENIAFFGGVYGLAGKRLSDREATVISMAGLAGFEGHLTGTLSGALQQRLALGCALLHEPPILFLDEPTSGVDPISRRLFWDLIQDMAAQGTTVLVTTHFLDEAEFCGRLGVIAGGRLISLDTPAGLKSNAIDEDVFELSLPNLADARERLRTVDGILASAFFGQHLHVFCRRGAFTADTLLQAAARAGLAPKAAALVPIRLEDVFIRLVERQS